MPDFSGLAELLGPNMSPEDFLANFFDQQAVVLACQHRRPAPFGGLLTLDDIDELLVRALLPGSPCELLIFKDLAYVTDYATPHAAFASGASLIVNRVDKAWPKLQELCVRLAAGFRYAYGNLYLTPHDSQTAPPHSDDHCVFILQVHGRKHWRVWPRAHPLTQTRPLTKAEEVGKDQTQPRLKTADLGPPELEFVLEPGDVLYIPRGVMHVADTSHVASGSPPDCSLHITVAIPTWDLSVSATLLHAVRATCYDDRSFRKALPLGPVPTPRCTHAESAANSNADAGVRVCVALDPKGAAAVRVRLSFAPCAEATSAGVPLASPPSSKLLGDDRLAEWKRVHRRLWAHVHTAVGPHDITAELNRRMQVQRTKQRDAYSRSIASFARSAADGSARPLRAATQLIKVVPIELFTPEPDWPAEDHRRVVQTNPHPHAHAHAHARPDAHPDPDPGPDPQAGRADKAKARWARPARVHPRTRRAPHTARGICCMARRVCLLDGRAPGEEQLPTCLRRALPAQPRSGRDCLIGIESGRGLRVTRSARDRERARPRTWRWASSLHARLPVGDIANARVHTRCIPSVQYD